MYKQSSVPEVSIRDEKRNFFEETGRNSNGKQTEVFGCSWKVNGHGQISGYPPHKDTSCDAVIIKELIEPD